MQVSQMTKKKNKSRKSNEALWGETMKQAESASKLADVQTWERLELQKKKKARAEQVSKSEEKGKKNQIIKKKT